MSRLHQFLDQLSGVVNVAHSTMFFDVGSANTRVYYQGRLVYNQPSCALFHEESKTVLQVGQPALLALDRSPGTMSAFFPIQQGYITDLTKSQAYLAALINQVLASSQQKMVMALTGVVAIPAGLSPVEEQMLERVLKRAGLTNVRLVKKPEAVATMLKVKGYRQPTLCVIDIGSQTTEIGLFVGSECRAATTFYLGGEQFTQKIKELVRTECQSLIGWPTAEKIKLQQKNSSFNIDGQKDKTIAIRAKNLLNLSPTTVLLKKSSLFAAYTGLAEEWLDEVSTFLAQQKSELVNSTLEQGIYLTGGGSQMTGLIEYLEEHLKCQVIKSAKPFDDVVTGLVASYHGK